MENLKKDISELGKGNLNTISDAIRDYKVNPQDKTLVDIIFDMLSLQDAMKDELKDKTIEDKRLLVKFAIGGMIFMFLSMLATLIAIGGIGEPILLDALFFAKFIGGVFASLGLSYFVSKLKEIVVKYVTDPEKAKEIIKQIIKKIFPAN